MLSCMKEEKGLTPQQVQHIADSIYQVKAKKIRKQATEDLDRRMSIELKPKIDSLLGRTTVVTATPLMNTDSAYEIATMDTVQTRNGDATK